MNYDDINEVTLEGIFGNPEDMGFGLSWDGGDAGFGMINFRFYTPETENEDYFIAIDSELMSKEFVKSVLCKMVDNAKLTHEIVGSRYEELKRQGRL